MQLPGVEVLQTIRFVLSQSVSAAYAFAIMTDTWVVLTLALIELARKRTGKVGCYKETPWLQKM